MDLKYIRAKARNRSKQGLSGHSRSLLRVANLDARLMTIHGPHSNGRVGVLALRFSCAQIEVHLVEW